MNHRNYSVSRPFAGSSGRVTDPGAAISAELASEMDDHDIVNSNCIAPGATSSPSSPEVDMLSYVSVDVATLDIELSQETNQVPSDLTSNKTEDVEDGGIVDKWERSGFKNILRADVGKKGIDFVDGAIVPIKHEIICEDARKKIFVEGKKLLDGGSKMQFHDANTLCIAYLDSSEEGILHVIPGWTQREV